MPESDDMAAARLETALERIARCAAERRAVPAGAAVMAGNDPRLRELASRLDALIASLRAVLGEQA